MNQIHNDVDRSKKEETPGTGSIDGLAFTVNDQPVQTAPHPNPQYIDIIKLLLNNPLLPGDSVIISTPFKVMLPPYFSRSGYADGEFVVCRWYPKPAVFDKNGWNEFPILTWVNFTVSMLTMQYAYCSVCLCCRCYGYFAYKRRIGNV